MQQQQQQQLNYCIDIYGALCYATRQFDGSRLSQGTSTQSLPPVHSGAQFRQCGEVGIP